MRLKKLAAALFLTAAASSPAAALDIDVSDFKLANGMEVVVIPDHRAPVVTHMVWYRVGAADEVSGKSGLAHFLEHLLFKGTKAHPPGEFDRLLEMNGGDGNAFTTRDYTAYYQRIAKDRLGLVMGLEADRMQNLVLTDENVLPELQVVREERRERTENDPSALLGEQVDAAQYTAHPYGRPVVGWMEEVAKLTRDDALAFYRANYTPANAVLVVAGDVTTEEVKALAEQSYGSLKNTFEPQPRVRTAEPEPIAARRVEMVDERTSSPMFQRNYLAPSYATDAAGVAEALDLLGEVLGGGAQGRLYKSLVVKDGIAAYAGAWYSGDSLDYGGFGVYGAPNDGKTLGEVERAIDAVLAELVAKGVPADELDRARNRLLDDRVYALDSQQALARMFGTALMTGQTVSDVLSWDERIRRVTAADVQKAAADILQLRRSVSATLLPEAPKQN